MFKLRQVETKQKVAGAKVAKIKQIICLALEQIKHTNKSSRNSDCSSPNKRRSDESSQSESIQEVLQHMKKGYLFLKHSVNTKEPHPKFVYLSQDNKYICWKSPQKEDEKRIEIESIDKVVKTGCEFYMKACKSISNINACVVICSQERPLELEASNEIEAEMFKDEMNRVIKHMQRMSYNYRYTKDNKHN